MTNAGLVAAGDESGPRQARIEALARRLEHPDRSQLFFQVAEIGGDEIYLRHGIAVGAGDVVIDVGANVGVAAVFFATICGARRVHCFEPVGPNAEILRANVRGLAACVVHELALGRADDQTTITYYPRADAMSGMYAESERDRAVVRQVLLNRGLDAAAAEAQLVGRHEPVPLPCEVRRLSTMLRELAVDRVDLLKIDVERSELDVLAGVDEADWPRIDQLVLEIHDEDGRGERIATELSDRGFDVADDQEATMRGTSIRMLYATRP